MLGHAIPLLIDHGIGGLRHDVSWRVKVTRRPKILRSPLDGTSRVAMHTLMRFPLGCVWRRVVSRGGWLPPQEGSANVANYISETLANAGRFGMVTYKFAGPGVKDLHFCCRWPGHHTRNTHRYRHHDLRDLECPRDHRPCPPHMCVFPWGRATKYLSKRGRKSGNLAYFELSPAKESSESPVPFIAS